MPILPPEFHAPIVHGPLRAPKWQKESSVFFPQKRGEKTKRMGQIKACCTFFIHATELKERRGIPSGCKHGAKQVQYRNRELKLPCVTCKRVWVVMKSRPFHTFPCWHHMPLAWEATLLLPSWCITIGAHCPPWVAGATRCQTEWFSIAFHLPTMMQLINPYLLHQSWNCARNPKKETQLSDAWQFSGPNNLHNIQLWPVRSNFMQQLMLILQLPMQSNSFLCYSKQLTVCTGVRQMKLQIPTTSRLVQTIQPRTVHDQRFAFWVHNLLS